MEFKLTKKDLYQVYSLFLHRFFKTYQVLKLKYPFNKKDLSKIFLIGGPTNSKFLENLLIKYFKTPICKNLDKITCVAKGAAIYGAEILNNSKNILLSDVLPISIGVELRGQYFEKIIPSNTKLPCFKVAEFTTSQDYQKVVKIKILEGERKRAEDCNFLGEILLEGVQVALRGVPVIKVGIEITEENIINAFVLDLKTNKKAKVQINSASRMAYEEILKIKEEAKKYEIQDAQYFQLIELNSQIGQIYTRLSGLNLTNLLKDLKLSQKYDHLMIKKETFTHLCYRDLEYLQSLRDELKDLDSQLRVHIEYSNIEKVQC